MEFDREIEEIIYMAMGAASVCWNPRPTGEFDSQAATEIGKEAIDKIRNLMANL